MLVGVLDYGSGNFGSVWNALEYLEVNKVRIDTPEQLPEVSHIVLPGVGTFPAAMRRLESLNLVQPLHEEVITKKKLFLGICVGMQILAGKGSEFEECDGLSYINGRVDKIEIETADLPLPHMGWNEIELNTESPLFRDLDADPSFYFVHSFSFRASNLSDVIATCQYGNKVVAAVQRDNIFGVQFHPEKSQRNGLKLLKNFSEL